jgi:outer membrane protein TolC
VYVLASAGGIGGANVATGGQEGAGLHIDMPVFSGGRLRGELRAADAEVRQAVADARSILDNVTLQVTLAHLAATTARRRIDRDRPAVVEARENLRLVRNRYRNGTATPTDIVDAETALTRAQQRLTYATYEYLAALASLDYALGNPTGHLLGTPDAPEKESTPAPQALPAPRPLPGPE